MTKLQRIEKALTEMAIGNCGVKWDMMVWRVSENQWQVGEDGIRSVGFLHDLASVLDWFKWKLQIN